MIDKHYLGQKHALSEMEHHYGPNVHILSDPFLFTTLATLCSPETKQPTFNHLLRMLYENLVRTVISHEFPRKPARVATRMAQRHAEAHFTAELLDREQKVVCVDLERAGTYPSNLCIETLNAVLDPEVVRQDHLLLSRRADPQHHEIGAVAGGNQIGGSVQDAVVLIPDPMGATGATMIEVLDLYKSGMQAGGRAKKFVALHLIVTPEYLRKLQLRHSDLVIYALRLDRGLSPPDILSTRPGEKWDSERGLSEEQYIVPGGGGFGELLHNAYV